MYKSVGRTAIIAASAALAASGTIGVAVAAQGSPTRTGRTLEYYAFDINNGTSDPGFIPVAGTNPGAFSQGDELIINDQVTVTSKRGSGYPIVGFDSGECTLTRLPEKYAEQTLGNCVVTVAWKNGSLTVQGVVRFKKQEPQPAALAVTGGTGRYDDAAGVLDVSFTKNHKILTFKLK
jgi:hypothetical protein